jgi:5-methylcytosine-specific restriction endonuclease McrA
MRRTEASDTRPGGTNPPRLTVELVPKTCHCSNLRSELPRADWDRLRRLCYHQAGYRCEVCGGRGDRHPLECHEVWEYDDDRMVQALAGVVALCPACHEVKHLLRATKAGRQEQALAHLAVVNRWTPVQTRRYFGGEGVTWARRSRVEWTLNLDKLRDYGIQPPPLPAVRETASRTNAHQPTSPLDVERDMAKKRRTPAPGTQAGIDADRERRCKQQGIGLGPG